MKRAVAIALAVCLIGSSTPLTFAQAASGSRVAQPGADPWPRNVSVNGANISIYQPQLNDWTGNLLDAYAAVRIKIPSSAVTNYGALWVTARTEVDNVNRR